jgi:hypothetical protein
VMIKKSARSAPGALTVPVGSVACWMSGVKVAAVASSRGRWQSPARFAVSGHTCKKYISSLKVAMLMSLVYDMPSSSALLRVSSDAKHLRALSERIYKQPMVVLLPEAKPACGANFGSCDEELLPYVDDT